MCTSVVGSFCAALHALVTRLREFGCKTERPACRAQVRTEPTACAELSRLQRLSIRGAWHSALAPDQLKAWAHAAASSLTLLCLSDDAGNADDGEQTCAYTRTRTRGVLSLNRLRNEAELHLRDAAPAARVLEPFAHLRTLLCLCLNGAMQQCAVASGPACLVALRNDMHDTWMAQVSAHCGKRVCRGATYAVKRSSSLNMPASRSA